MKRPVIGITCLIDNQVEKQTQNETYVQAVLQVGGIPVLLPAVTDQSVIAAHLEMIDGLLVSGGPDLDPSYFGQEPWPELGRISPLMDVYEMNLLARALEMDMPILGICRGEQVLNVVAGGTLHQDIYRTVKGCLKHRQESPRETPSHKVALVPGTKLAAMFPTAELLVNSFHHQSVADLAPGFVASALASDGIIEAIESQRHSYAVGIQWHPECMWSMAYNYRGVFETFVVAATDYAKR